MSLAVAARSEQGGVLPDDPEADAAREVVLRNDWIEKLPYVTDVQPGWEVSGNGPKDLRSAEHKIVVMTDTQDHVTVLEKQVPGSLEGFPVIVVVDRSKQWELESEQMMAKAQHVIDDPANKWILRIPHVMRMLPSTVQTTYGEPTTPAVGIAVDRGRSIKEVQSKIPKTLGGFPTRFGWVEGLGECFTNTGKGCDRDDDDDHNDDLNSEGAASWTDAHRIRWWVLNAWRFE
jgi:hypothetical protein